MRSHFGLYQGSNAQRNGGPEVPMGSILSKSHSSNGRMGIWTSSCLPGPTLRGPQAHLMAMTQE